MIPNVMLIGFGEMGRQHYDILYYLQKEKKVNIVSVVDKNKSKLSELENKIGYTSVSHAFYETNPDIVAVVTNTATHKDIIDEVLNYGNPSLFIEKPIVEGIEEANQIVDKLKEKGYGDKIPIGFGYLIRYSPSVKEAIKYINDKSLKINGFYVRWQKIRGQTRPSPGVHIDDTTHAVDTIINYILPRTGNKNKKISLDDVSNFKYSKSIINTQLQKEIYGNDKLTPLAEMEYKMSCDNNISITGFSSFMKLPFERYIEITCDNNYSLKVKFDYDETDSFEVTKDDKLIDSKPFLMKKINKNKIYLEWNSFLCYFKTNRKSSEIVTLDQALFDIKLTELMGDENLFLPFII